MGMDLLELRRDLGLARIKLQIQEQLLDACDIRHGQLCAALLEAIAIAYALHRDQRKATPAELAVLARFRQLVPTLCD